MLIPYKADIALNRFPVITVLVCLICSFIYFTQHSSRSEFQSYTVSFCQAKHTRMLERVFINTFGEQGYYNCPAFLSNVYQSGEPDNEIEVSANQSSSFHSYDAETSRKIIHKALLSLYQDYVIYVPEDLTSRYWYAPKTWSIPRMVTNVLAHGDIWHLLGNLFFFFAFAASVEIIVGMRKFCFSFLFMAIGTSSLYSLYSIATNQFQPTLGLSGLVYGYMGLFVYFLPTVGIRTVFWFIIPLTRMSIPAWLMVGAYFGLDVWRLLNLEQLQEVNLIAHVSGGALGYLLGVAAFSVEKKRVNRERNRSRF